MGLGLGTKQVIFLPQLEAPARPASRWPLYAALAFQLGLLALLPGHKYAAAASPTIVMLRVASVDPVDPLRGRYVDLQYDVGQADTLSALPGWTNPEAGQAVFVTLESGIGPDTPWRAVAASVTRPASLKPGQALLQGTMRNGRLDLGIDRYHVDASRGDDLDQAMSRAGTLAEVRVDDAGHPALTALRIGDRRF